jgi:hypothetical protein
LHAHPGNEPSPSHLDTTQAESLTLHHPISALLALIRSNSITADLLLSPGDLGDRANPSGIAYAWSALAKLAKELRCEAYAATAGNHDLDSRFNDSEVDPRYVLRGLTPSFPFQDETLDDKYWSRAYSIKDSSLVRLVLLNSSALHGYTPIEQNHGRVTSFTLTQLKADLTKLDPKPINVLLCHHHPHQHSELDLGETDVMKKGQQLLDLLGAGENGRWLVIHGHKHHPKIAYAAGGSTSPTVFAAGSLCAILSGQLQTAARNQFYLIEFDVNECAKYGLVGTVRAWDWSAGVGWIEAASKGSGLPARFGFGSRMEPLVLATRIANAVEKAHNILTWEDICTDVPEMKYLLPQDLKEVERALEANYKLAIDYDGTKIVQVGKL